MITIFGRMSSINVQKVVFAAGELGLAYERKEAGGQFGVVDTPEYRAMNPNGLIPVLDDDGLVLWESNAIVRYLAARYGQGTLWPQEPGERALCDRWMDWQTTALNPAFGPAFMNLVRTPPEKRDAAAVEASRAKTEVLLEILDAQLEGRSYIEANRLTIADIAVGPAVHRWLNMPIARQARPNVERWYASLYARPAAKAAMPLPVT